MKQTTQLIIEHIVVTSERSYEQVIEALEAQLGQRANWDEAQHVLITIGATFECNPQESSRQDCGVKSSIEHRFTVSPETGVPGTWLSR